MRVATRQLGKTFKFADHSVDGLLREKEAIRKGLWDHGCICIKQVDFGPQQMTAFTSKMWNEAIELPVFLMFNNQDPSYKTVARVGNVLADGTLKDSQKEAAYWHQDGNFWGEGKKHIFNCLHSK